MIKKILKRVFMVLFATLTLTTVNCFATNINEKTIKIDGIEYIEKVFNVTKEQEEDFLLNLENELHIEDKHYTLDNKEKTGGDIIETIDISTSKTIKSNSNKLDDILKQLPAEIEYDKSDFKGKYKIDINSIKIKSQYNGYKEYLVEETKVYTNLDNNDLNNIPKQIMKEGMVLDLIKTNWEITETRMIQENSIPSKYKANCYYATKKRVDNPLTYIVTAEYNGTADKVIENDFEYKVRYKHTSTDINYIPYIVLGTSSVIIIILLLTRKKNAIIYNYNNKEWREIGKQRIRKPVIKLNRYMHKSLSNRYKIVLDEKFVDKYNGTMFKIVKNKRTSERLLNKSNNTIPYTIDVVI